MKTTEKFIEEAKEAHGCKYDYSNTEYLGYYSKLRIICPQHGEFWQMPNNHLNGQGCPICGKIKAKQSPTLGYDGFIEEAKKVHGDRYDYSNVKYVNNKTKVCIICPQHGEFWQTPINHLNGQGCRKCSIEKQKITKSEFIEKAKKVHGNKYDYSKVKFNNNKEKICIICPEHGEFWQRLNSHLNGAKCPSCGQKQRIKTIRETRGITQEEFINRAKKVHGDRYDYSKVKYVNIDTKVCIICPEHGEFWQTPYAHLIGQGCPMCNESHLERDIRMLLNENSINFIQRATKQDIPWIGRQHLDFYLPDYNIAIECQGEQHFKPIEVFGGKEEHNKTKRNDEKKKKLCEENNIKLLYYTNFLCEESKNMFFRTDEILKAIYGSNIEKF